VLLAEGEEEMRSVIERLERYLGKKRVELNTEKSKIMRFRRGGGREKKREWERGSRKQRRLSIWDTCYRRTGARRHR